MSAAKLIFTVVMRGGIATAEQISNSLPTMQKLVGGYIEHVALRGRFAGMSLWCNETGMLDKLPVSPCPMYPGPICGDYFVTRSDTEGETTSLTPEDLALLMEVLS